MDIADTMHIANIADSVAVVDFGYAVDVANIVNVGNTMDIANIVNIILQIL